MPRARGPHRISNAAETYFRHVLQVNGILIINERVRDRGPWAATKIPLAESSAQGFLTMWRRPHPPFYQFQFVFL
ncbi:hypothetical protein MY1884_000150 [Beauveria asiatica]